MSNHRAFVAGSDGAYQGKCSCRQRGPVVAQRWEADDWTVLHIRQVNRARAHLGAHHPSLEDQRDWYRTQADRTDIPQYERDMWEMLADGLDHRVGKPHQDEPLF
jgi:hypothetical protein